MDNKESKVDLSVLRETARTVFEYGKPSKSNLNSQPAKPIASHRQRTKKTAPAVKSSPR